MPFFLSLWLAPVFFLSSASSPQLFQQTTLDSLRGGWRAPTSQQQFSLDILLLVSFLINMEEQHKSEALFLSIDRYLIYDLIGLGWYAWKDWIFSFAGTLLGKQPFASAPVRLFFFGTDRRVFHLHPNASGRANFSHVRSVDSVGYTKLWRPLVSLPLKELDEILDEMKSVKDWNKISGLNQLNKN